MDLPLEGAVFEPSGESRAASAWLTTGQRQLDRRPIDKDL
jgi:hypothetical protein